MLPPPRGLTGTSEAGRKATGYEVVATAVARATRPLPVSVTDSPTGTYRVSATPSKTLSRDRRWVCPATCTWRWAASGTMSASWPSSVTVCVPPAPRSTT
jgi:hypothetical protein